MDEGLRRNYFSAMTKIRSVLKLSEQDMLENLERQIIVKKIEPCSNVAQAPANTLELLLSAIAQRKQLSLDYKGVQDETYKPRKLEPVGLFFDQNNWYTFAYCHMRADYRQFRIDRISKIEILEELFSKTHPELKELMPEMESNFALTEARVRVDKTFADFMKWDRQYYGFVSEREVGDEVEMQFLLREIDVSFPRWLLMFGDRLTVVKPISLHQEMQALLEAQLERIKNSDQ